MKTWKKKVKMPKMDRTRLKYLACNRCWNYSIQTKTVTRKTYFEGKVVDEFKLDHTQCMICGHTWITTDQFFKNAKTLKAPSSFLK